jgi:hypothetical protein
MKITCDGCAKPLWLESVKYEGKVYCCEECRDYTRFPHFCATCLSESTGENAGNQLTLNFVGKRFAGGGRMCPDCLSVERWSFIWAGIPLLPDSKWKVKYINKTQFYSRRIDNAAARNFRRRYIAIEVIVVVLAVVAFYVFVPQ